MDLFHTLAEVAVAIAGFSSLVIVFRGNAARWSGQDYISLAFALCWSIGSVFLALLGALRVLPGPIHGWYAFVLMLLMLHATAELGLFVFQSLAPHSTGRPDP